MMTVTGMDYMVGPLFFDDIVEEQRKLEDDREREMREWFEWFEGRVGAWSVHSVDKSLSCKSWRMSQTIITIIAISINNVQ